MENKERILLCSTKSKIISIEKIPIAHQNKAGNVIRSDTIIILHVLNVAKQNPFSQLKVVSPDTDAFLLLVHYFLDLPVLISSVTGKVREAVNVQLTLGWYKKL